MRQETPRQFEATPGEPVRWHPFAEIFPWLEGAAFDELVEDIRKNGVIEPIVFLDGAILDGRNRYMAARHLGIEYPRVEYEGDDPLAFVITKNLARRHLSESQRAMVAAKIAKLPRGGDRKSDAFDQTANLRTDRVAETLNVSPRSVETARQVQRDAVPELAAAVETGQVSVSAASEVSRLPKEEQAEIVAQGPEAVVQAAKHVRGTFGTGDNEWFTPGKYIELAREALKEIDLDPASHPLAQETVKAKQFFTKDDDGLSKEWHGRIWLNPPYAYPIMPQFIDKLLEELEAGRTKAAILLTHNYSDTEWFQKAAAKAAMLCFPRGRIRFVHGDRGEVASPTQGQTFFYFGSSAQHFGNAFAELGFVATVRRAFA